MAATVHQQHPAMATLFEVFLSGEDAEHLEAVAAACFEEIARVERLLSRFDPAGEIARINRDAARRPVQVDIELWHVLGEVVAWWHKTDGYFDVTAAGGRLRSPLPEAVRFDEARRTVQFARDDVRLDLGGYGKGYALDRAAELVQRYGVSSALLHGGTSSVRVLGSAPDGGPWRVGLRDPCDEHRELGQLELRDCGLSSSAALERNGKVSDVIVPHTGAVLDAQAGCFVVAPDARTAEVLSTALLAMGKPRAVDYTGSRLPRDIRAGWIDRRSDQSYCEWLTDPACPSLLLPPPDATS